MGILKFSTVVAMMGGWLMAQANPPLHVTEIVNFYCPASYQAYQSLSAWRRSLPQQAVDFDVMPVFADAAHGWPARAWLALPKAQASLAEAALFQAAIVQGLPMASLATTCEVLERVLPNYSMADCAHSTQSDRVLQRLAYSLQLLKRIRAHSQSTLLFPVFVIEKSGEIQAVLMREANQDMALFIEQVSDAIQAMR